VGGVALVAAIGVTHGLARWLWHACAPAEETRLRPWRFRWSLSMVFLVVFVFAAGIAMVVTVHEVGWLFSTDEPMITSSMSAARRAVSSNNLKQIGLGMHNYHDTHHRFPPGGTFDRYGEGQHSWETLLLPYLENPAKPNLQLPWNHRENEEQFKREVHVFLNPAFPDRKDKRGYGLSHYALNSRIARANFGIRMEEATDGTSTTIMAGEVNARFKPWGDPVNWRDPSLGINKSPDGFGSAKKWGGSQFLLMDGSVRFLSETTDPEVLKALSTPAGGEPREKLQDF
jgi:hypothetical protein